MRGDLLGAGSTGEVFRTVAPAANNTFWRLYCGGVAAGNERGQLFANTGETHFNINAPNGHLRLYTNTIERARLYQTQTSNIPLLGGGSVSVAQNGFAAISGTPAFFNAGSYGPFTRLHLVDEDPTGIGAFFYAQPWGFRTWMRNGITLTGNHDHSYIGQRYYGLDETDLVIHWSDNPNKPECGPDRLRFIFPSQNTGATEGAQSLEGLEFMRMKANSALQGFVGVGNYARPGISPDPEPAERLDVLDRTIRLRDFVSPTLYRNDTYDRVLVANPADGRVYWRPVSSITGGSGSGECEWKVLNETTVGATTPHHVYTAEGPSDDACPDGKDLVGIGIAPSNAKLEIVANMVTNGLPNTGVYMHMETDATSSANGVDVLIEPDGAAGFEQAGVNARSYNSAFRNIGIRGRAYNQGTNANSDGNFGALCESIVSGGSVADAFGVKADASLSGLGTVTRNHAVFAKALGGGTAYGLRTDVSGATNNYGIWSEVYGAGTNYAGYFIGDVYINGVAGCTLMNWTSDGNLKTNVEDISGAMSLIGLLRPTTYEFDVQGHPSLGLPTGLQRGLIAQEVAEVMPDLVQERTLATYTDHAGVEHQGETIKSLNYIGLIPMMIAALQEQQATIDAGVATNASLLASVVQLQQRADEQEARIAGMLELLNECCARPADQRDHFEQGGMGVVRGAERILLSIQPNPVGERTTVYYTLEHSGRMQLMANGADGKQLGVLNEATQEAGQYRFDWNTGTLAPGMYYVTLLLDGEQVTQKAVKLDR